MPKRVTFRSEVFGKILPTCRAPHATVLVFNVPKIAEPDLRTLAHDMGRGCSVMEKVSRGQLVGAWGMVRDFSLPLILQ